MIEIEDKIVEFSEVIGEKTNNEAEYEALIFGLKKVKKVLGKAKAKKEAKLQCFLDSELVVRQLNHEYKLREQRIQKYPGGIRVFTSTEHCMGDGRQNLKLPVGQRGFIFQQKSLSCCLS